MSLRLEPTAAGDLPRVLELERDPDVAPWISAWSYARHLDAIESSQEAHLSFRDANGCFAGFLLLAGLSDPRATVELRRIALANRGTGLGAAALGLAFDHAFGLIGAHRVWLDVVPGNARALTLYERLGLEHDGQLLHESHLLPDGSSTHLWVMSISRSGWTTRPKSLTRPHVS